MIYCLILFRFQGWMGRMYFMKSPFCLIDVVTIRNKNILLNNEENLTRAGGQTTISSPSHIFLFFPSEPLRNARLSNIIFPIFDDK